MSGEARTATRPRGRLHVLARRAGRRVPGQQRLQRAWERLPGADSLGRRVAVNSSWLIAERILRMAISLAIAIQVVRYLGPTDYGILAYGLSIVTIVDVVSTLGMRSSVVRELVEHPRRAGEVLGTSVGLRLLGSLLTIAVIFALWARDPGSPSLTVLAVLAAGLPLMAFAQLDLYFQATLESHHAAAARTIALLVASVVRVALLVAGAPLLWFAAAGALEFASTGVAFIVTYYRRRGSLLGLRMSLPMSRRIVAISWPFFLSSLAAAVYLKVDQVMLQHYSGSTEVGVYAAAARLSEIWYFVPIALASSILPMLVQRRLEDERAYRRSLEQAFRVAVWIAITIALLTTLAATPIVALLFGDAFARSADILRLHMWAAPFIFMGAVLGRALITEDRRAFELSRHVAGAVLNVGLNAVLIPAFGGMGAAAATLISYAFASYVICFGYGPTRMHVGLMTRAVIRPFGATAA